MLSVSCGMHVDLQVIFGDSWRVLRKVLTSDIQRAMDAYWNRARREEGTGQLISPSAEVHTMPLIHCIASCAWHLSISALRYSSNISGSEAQCQLYAVSWARPVASKLHRQ